jgi:hypothetical protein
MDVATRMTRAATITYLRHVEDEENDPDRLAEDAVVARVNVPLTDALVPDAVSVKLKLADPEPPATASSSEPVSSIMISIGSPRSTVEVSFAGWQTNPCPFSQRHLCCLCASRQVSYLERAICSPLE